MKNVLNQGGTSIKNGFNKEPLVMFLIELGF